MNLISKITSGTLALVLATGIAGSAFASDDVNETSVEVIPVSNGGNVLSVSINDLNFGSWEYSLKDRDVAGEVSIGVSDMRGVATGWNVTLTSTNFDDGLDINNLGLVDGEVVKTSTGTNHSTSANPAINNVVGVEAGTGYNVLNAVSGTGAGEYVANYDASLRIPAGTLVGEYEATITVTITGDEPGDD